jgi:RNA polymerase sigma factor (TIGR02999 family)
MDVAKIMESDPTDITGLLLAARSGTDRSAMDRIVAALYPSLHRLAEARLASNGTLSQLDATSIIHETYTRLCSGVQINASCRGQFMAYAAQVMRSVVVDYVRKRRAERRGGGAIPVTLTTSVLNIASSDEDVERVHDALLELEETDPRLKRVVEMRFFGGFSETEIAVALGVTDRTVRRDWERARLLLKVAIQR